MTRQLEDGAMNMVEAAEKLLEAEGYIITPGVYPYWAVVPTRQEQTLGYVAFLLPAP